MDKKILFTYKLYKNGFIRIGEFGFIYRACYFRGKELGYKDIHIVWPDKLEFTREHHLQRNKMKMRNKPLTMKCPDDTILPITFVDRKKVKPNDYDEVIDISESNAFYDGSEPIFIKLNNNIVRSNIAPYEFLNKYYITHKRYPQFHIKKDILPYKYVLVHTRNALNSKSRNPKVNNYLSILQLLKKYHSEYKIFRCGETYSNTVEKEFSKYIDEYYPPTDKFNDYLKLINNSSIFVGCPSGPIEQSKAFRIPIIEIDIPKCVWDKKSSGLYASHHYCFYSQEYWKNTFNSKYGNTIDDNVNQKYILRFYRNDGIDINKIKAFMEKFL